MPTRNRAQLLPFALDSALAQTYGNIEIIISNNASTDATDSFLSQVKDPRVRVVRTEAVLPFHEHWRFLLGHANGNYVVFLCDDDAFVPEAISRGMQAMNDTGLDLVCWRWAFFSHETRAVRFGLGTDVPHRASAESTAQLLLNGDFSAVKPQLNNCLILRSELTAMIDSFPYAFSPFGGDFATAIYLLGTRKEYVVIDRPLSIFSLWRGSLSYAVESLDHAAVDDYMTKAGGYPPMPIEMPLHYLPLLANRIFSNLRAAALAIPTAAGLKWNPTLYFLVAWNEIVASFDSENNRQRFRQTLDQFPSVRTYVLNHLGSKTSFQKKIAPRGVRHRAFVQRIERSAYTRVKCIGIF